MDNSSPLILYSRSAATTDWRCPRARYWGYEHLGRGVSAETTGLELFLGTTLHDAIAAIANGVDIEKIAQAAVAQVRSTLLKDIEGDTDSEYYAWEQATLVEGLLRGFQKVVWPHILTNYPEIIAIEREFTYNHDGLTFMSKPDLIARDTDGDLTYFEWKSTSSTKEQWINSWSTAIQLHSSVRAVEASLGEKVSKVVVVGLNKGYVAYGKQNSPFCYGYFKAGEPPFSRDTWSYDYRYGLKKYPVWQRAGGVREWVEKMPIETLREQFPMTPPIFINDALVDAFFRQQGRRESDIRLARDTILDPECMPAARERLLDIIFPQHYENCNPGWGKGCQFMKICHGPQIDPLQMGYSLRHSHHEIEQAQFDE